MSHEISAHDLHPDAIDTRLVLRMYAWIAITAGVVSYGWIDLIAPSLFTSYDLPGVPFGRSALIRTISGAVAALGFVAVGLSRIENPVSRRRALLWFAAAHLVFGSLFYLQWMAILVVAVPGVVAWTPLTIGIVLVFIAATAVRTPRLRPFKSLFDSREYGPLLVERGRSMNILRSQYEEHVRQAARAEERARLARDLHDAVKQQLFAIQTAAATAQTRLDDDTSGARTAIEQVRASARDAMNEMKALIEQLQASPLENTGLVAALQQQCEALELRTGAHVSFETGVLPPSTALIPGTQQALFRAAQEALSNVARHARAAHVTVRLGLSGNNLELTVSDDGAGFDPIQRRTSMGLQNMKARVCEMSGGFLLKTAPGKGTLVGFAVPCDVRTARDYAWRVLTWVAVLAVMIASFAVGSPWERPWKAIFAVIAAITVARYAAAWHRVRARGQATA